MTRRFETIADALLAGFMQQEISGTRYSPIDSSALDEEERSAFSYGYEAAMDGEACPTPDDLAAHVAMIQRLRAAEKEG